MVIFTLAMIAQSTSVATIVETLAHRELVIYPSLAFAGIARPAKFFATLRAEGALVVETASFADHHRYAPDEVMRLVERAAALGAVPVTTEKDQVRLPVAPPAEAPAPAMGEHTRTILGEGGFSAEEIDALVSGNVVR